MTNKIYLADVCLDELEKQYLNDAISSGWISSKGEYITRFEEQFADYIGVKHAIAVSNGTCALTLALSALGIGQGDEVIIPNLTFAATANAIIHTGATPKLVDCEPDNWGIDPEAVINAITENTKAILPVHLYGQPCNIDAINTIAKRHDLYVIEDVAEALGANVQGKYLGTLGDIGCFSFFANKIITTGEGGMCITNNDEVCQKLRILRDHGMDPQKRYWHLYPGYNFRMTNLSAAIGLAQIEKINSLLNKRDCLANYYQNKFSSLSNQIEIIDSKHGEMVHWLYVVLLSEQHVPFRDRLIDLLAERQIETRPVFYPLHSMPAFSSMPASLKLANSERLSQAGICLPLHPNLQKSDIDRIVDTFNEILESHA